MRRGTDILRIPTPWIVCGCLSLLSIGCSNSGTGGEDRAGGASALGGSVGQGGASATGGSGGASGASGVGGAGNNGTSVGGNGGGGGASATGGVGGSSGAAGSGGHGGAAVSGGNGGHGGASTSGGGAGSGTGGASGGGGTGTTASCTFTASSSLSSKIPTVGIVSWSTTLPSVQSAQIDFGLTAAYGMTAPVDLTAAGYRTLLLGMKASKTYHFRLSASGTAGSCLSGDYTLTTGALASELPRISVTTSNASAVFGGFLIAGQYLMSGNPAPAYIVDADGDLVWWYTSASDATGVRMSHDGHFMWINSANVPNSTAHVHRVSMDGLTDDDYSSQFTGQSHQLTVLPDETIAFYAYGTNGCEDIKERAPSGTVKTIVNSETAHGGTGGCHINTIQYSQPDDTLVFSDLDHNCVTKVTRTGTTVWVLGGGYGGVTSSFTGDTWLGGEHGIHILGLDDFVIFNNNSTYAAGSMTRIGGSNNGSSAIELKLNLTAKTSTQSWAYKASPGIQNDVMGDVQRLPNGNTLVAFSTKGVLQEVAANGSVVQTLSWPTGTAFGYVEKRATLYGPPPK